MVGTASQNWLVLDEQETWGQDISLYKESFEIVKT